MAQIESEVLALPLEQRASLARRLLLSLEEATDAEFDRLWGEESARRAAELDCGSVELVSGELAAANARARLK